MTLFSDRKPDFVNEEGTKWWRENGVLDRHAKRVGEDYSVWIAENVDGLAEYLIFKGQELIYAHHLFENIAVELDVYQLLEEKEDA